MTTTEQIAMSNSLVIFDEVIPSDPKLGCDLITKIIANVTEHGWPEADIFKIHMALEEAIMNAIKHGNQNNESLSVIIKVRLEENWFFADISDEGTGFNREDVPDPTLEENLLKESGRGVMLMENFMSTLEYVGCGNRVKMSKKRDLPVD